MEVGTIIRTKHNVRHSLDKNDWDYKYKYYTLCDGPFRVWNNKYQCYSNFQGKYFLCEGSDYFHQTKGEICGFEILHNEKYYDIIDKLPDNLIK